MGHGLSVLLFFLLNVKHLGQVPAMIILQDNHRLCCIPAPVWSQDRIVIVTTFYNVLTFSEYGCHPFPSTITNDQSWTKHIEATAKKAHQCL